MRENEEKELRNRVWEREKKNNIELKKEKERKSMEKLENSCKIVR